MWKQRTCSDFPGQSQSFPFALPGCWAVMPALTDSDQWVLRIIPDCRRLGKRTVHHLNGRVLIVVQKHNPPAIVMDFLKSQMKRHQGISRKMGDTAPGIVSTLLSDWMCTCQAAPFCAHIDKPIKGSVHHNMKNQRLSTNFGSQIVLSIDMCGISVLEQNKWKLVYTTHLINSMQPTCWQRLAVLHIQRTQRDIRIYLSRPLVSPIVI